MIVGPRNDFTMKCLVAWYIDLTIIEDQAFNDFYPLIMVDRSFNLIILFLIVLGCTFDLLVCFFDSEHDHGSEVFRFKSYDFVVVFLSLIMIHMSAEKICFLVGGTGLVMECEMIFCEFSDPASLVSVQLLWLSEILEVLMIYPDLRVLSSSHKVVSPLVKRKHDCEQLLVIDLVVLLCDCKCFG